MGYRIQTPANMFMHVPIHIFVHLLYTYCTIIQTYILAKTQPMRKAKLNYKSIINYHFLKIVKYLFQFLKNSWPASI